MPQEPEFDLERLLAEDEAAIRDDGFSKRVADEVGRSKGVRTVTLYGAGMVGFGIAVGSMVEFFPRDLTNWFGEVNATVTTDLGRVSQVGEMLQGGGVPMLAALAIAGGLLFSIIAVATQGR